MFYVFLLLLYEIKSIYYFFLTMYINRSLAMSTAAVWCRVVWSRNVHPCYMVSRCPVSRCPPLLSGAALSGLAMSTLAIWSRIVQSHYVSSHNFDGLVMSGLAFSASPICRPGINNLPTAWRDVRASDYSHQAAVLLLFKLLPAKNI